MRGRNYTVESVKVENRATNKTPQTIGAITSAIAGVFFVGRGINILRAAQELPGTLDAASEQFSNASKKPSLSNLEAAHQTLQELQKHPANLSRESLYVLEEADNQVTLVRNHYKGQEYDSIASTVLIHAKNAMPPIKNREKYNGLGQGLLGAFLVMYSLYLCLKK